MRHIQKFIGDGMVSWIRLFFVLNLTGCTLINDDTAINISQEIKDSPYAMQVIQVEDEFKEIFLLSNVDNQTQKWFKDDEVFFTVKQGKIIKSIGLENDFEILSYSGFNSLKHSKALIRFQSPESDYMDIFFTYKVIKKGLMKKIINDEEFEYTLVEESFDVPLIRWSGKNYYWIDNESDIWMSKQLVDPFGKKARINVLKKYSD